MKRFIRALDDDGIEVYLSTDPIVEVFEGDDGAIRVGTVTNEYYTVLRRNNTAPDFKTADELVDYIERL